MSVVPNFLGGGGRIALSPWSAAAMDPQALAILEARAAALGVNVSTIKRSRQRSWMVRVRRGDLVTSLVGKGPLVAVIAGALDDFEMTA